MVGEGGNGRPFNLANSYSFFQFHQKYHNQGRLPYHRLDEASQFGPRSILYFPNMTPYFSVIAFQILSLSSAGKQDLPL